jgi:DNA helicase II / ATP-dependent DNA helicase PcrA
MKLTDGQRRVLDAKGHLLVVGGPGSGKTTISILKAAQIAEQDLRLGQSVLFLSFARATVSRVVESIEHEQQIPSEQKKHIQVETYHSFFWQILKTHGYLLGLPRRLEILAPPAETIALSGIRARFPARNLSDAQKLERQQAVNSEQLRLATQEGRVCFDLYASYVGDLLHSSSRIRTLLAAMYPVIILDEFQDTNHAQWRCVQAFGRCSRLIALADPEQRIYDWIGADPARLEHYKAEFTVTHFDFSNENHRSAGTEIALFGNHLLTSQFSQSTYSGVTIKCFDSFSSPAMTALVTATYAARKRLIDANVDNWSLAILVPTKKLTRVVSDALRQPPAQMPAVAHAAVIEMEAAILGAEVIARLLQPCADPDAFSEFVELICNYYQGKGGGEPTKGALQEAERIHKAYLKARELWVAKKTIRSNSLIVNIKAVFDSARALVLTGDPETDWLQIRDVLAQGGCSRLKEIADEVRNIRLLDRGTQLRQALSQDWREHRAYKSALLITRQAFVREHFSTSSKPESGVIVMNMHKAKGRQFDEVIIFEGWPVKQKGKPPYNPDRIVMFNRKDNINTQARQNLRVSVTRGKRHVTILTPKDDPCVLFS